MSKLTIKQTLFGSARVSLKRPKIYSVGQYFIKVTVFYGLVYRVNKIRSPGCHDSHFGGKMFYIVQIVG